MTGTDLKAFRAKWRLTQRELARELRKAVTTVRNWERARPPYWLDVWVMGWETVKWEEWGKDG